MDFQELPIGFAMGLSMNAKAMSEYGHLSEAKKEELILRCKDAKSKEEMDRIINSIGEGNQDGTDFPGDIFQGPGIG